MCVSLQETIKVFVKPKEASEKVVLFNIVEEPSNGFAITILTNRSRILSAYKYTEDMNAELTPHASSSIRSQLATNESSVV